MTIASGETSQQSMTWLIFALLTVASWGVYGIFLHKGSVQMGGGEVARYKAFLFVGIAYFLIAIVGPIVMMLVRGAEWTFTGSGMWWSLLAGIVGAIGAFCVLLAFGFKGTPTVVMSIIFAGAPILNALVEISTKKQWDKVSMPFLAGIVMAAAGGFLVVKFKPHGPPPAKKVAASGGVGGGDVK